MSLNQADVRQREKVDNCTPVVVSRFNDNYFTGIFCSFDRSQTIQTDQSPATKDTHSREGQSFDWHYVHYVTDS